VNRKLFDVPELPPMNPFLYLLKSLEVFGNAEKMPSGEVNKK
jgi:hypothetical protein